MKKFSIKFFAFAFVLSMMVSCFGGGYTLVGSSVYKGADMSDYNTFRLPSVDEVELPKMVSKMDYENIVFSVCAEMSLRGFRQDPNADLVIEFGMTMDQSYQESTSVSSNVYGPYGAYYWGAPRYAGWRTAGYMYPASYSTTVKSVKEGILIMDFIDTKNKKHVYSAAVKTDMAADHSKIKDMDEINKATTVLFKKFPIEIQK